MIYDTVKIGKTTVASMAIEVADAVGSYSDYPADGILGLGWGRINRGMFRNQFEYVAWLEYSTFGFGLGNHLLTILTAIVY